jgi:hypothetical protein
MAGGAAGVIGVERGGRVGSAPAPGGAGRRRSARRCTTGVGAGGAGGTLAGGVGTACSAEAASAGPTSGSEMSGAGGSLGGSTGAVGISGAGVR